MIRVETGANNLKSSRSCYVLTVPPVNRKLATHQPGYVLVKDFATTG